MDSDNDLLQETNDVQFDNIFLRIEQINIKKNVSHVFEEKIPFNMFRWSE